MSPPHLRVEEDEGQSNVTPMPSRASVDGTRQSSLMERNYLGLSECVSIVDGCAISIASEASKTSLNLKATELRLGLPGSESPERDSDTLFSSSELDEKPLFPLRPLRDRASSSVLKTVASGSKRGFYDAMDCLSENEKLGTSDVDVILSPHPSSNSIVKFGPKKLMSTIRDVDNHTKAKNTVVATNESAPASKAQVVGWPPIRSFRKNSLASKNTEVDGKAGLGALFIKVSMDGAPYLRKIDLKAFNTYKELSSSLEKMFSWITIGQCASHSIAGREMLSESKLKDLIHGSEYVLTYEDKDSDWMLVGDVPWEMFICTCKRMRIMKSSDAIGLGNA